MLTKPLLDLKLVCFQYSSRIIDVASTRALDHNDAPQRFPRNQPPRSRLRGLAKVLQRDFNIPLKSTVGRRDAGEREEGDTGLSIFY